MEKCVSCGKVLEGTWVCCPYCGKTVKKADSSDIPQKGFSTFYEETVDVETTGSNANMSTEYEFRNMKLPMDIGLPERLLKNLPSPDLIAVLGFSNAGKSFGEKYYITNGQDFIHYFPKSSFNKNEVFSCSFHPFIRRFTKDVIKCAKNIVRNGDSNFDYDLSDGELNTLINGWHYQETSDYIHGTESERESYHDGGGYYFTDWFIYKAQIAECKTDLTDEIGFKKLPSAPYLYNLPDCRGVWEEDGHVYLVDPWEIPGIYEYYCYKETRSDYESKMVVSKVGKPFAK